jgi:tetratricopeptide (TPR) repeat protein
VRPPSGAQLRRRGHLRAAEPLLRDALARAEREPSDVLALAHALNELGLWCKEVARYDEAVEHYQRARRLLEGAGGGRADDLAALDHNLAGIEHARGDFTAGEVLARRGLAYRLASPRPDAKAVAEDLIALAALLDGQCRWEEAEALYVTGLGILRRMPGEATVEIAVALSGLGSHYTERGRYEEATALLEQAAELRRRVLGPDHPDLALTLYNLAVTCRRSGDVSRAASLHAEAIAIFEQALGPEHPKTRACAGRVG